MALHKGNGHSVEAAFRFRNGRLGLKGSPLGHPGELHTTRTEANHHEKKNQGVTGQWPEKNVQRHDEERRATM